MDSDCVGRWDDACKNAVCTSNVVVALLTDNVKETSVVHQEVALAADLCDKGELKFVPIMLTKSKQYGNLDNYTKIICGDGLSDDKLNELYVKVENYLQSLLCLPCVSDTVEKIQSKNSRFFVGREKEIAEIKRHFDNGAKTVVISGIGGIGKTELAKKFVLQYGNEYPKSFIIKIETSDVDETRERDVKELVTRIQFEGTPNTNNVDEVYNKNLQLLRNLDSRTILIIDGYDVNLDLVNNIWQIFDNLSCEVIFTSRQKSESVPVIDVAPLSGDEAAAIFAEYCPSVSRQDALSIAEGVEYHTLTMELAARLLGQSRLVTPDKLKQSVWNVQGRLSHHRDNKMATIMEHIANIFDLSNLSQFQMDVLATLSRICNLGLTFDELCKVVQVTEENEHELTELVNAGLIRDNGAFSMHLVVSEVAFRKLAFTAEQEVQLLYLLIEKLQFDTADDRKINYDKLEYANFYVEKRFPTTTDKEVDKWIGLFYIATIRLLYHFCLYEKNVQICNSLIKFAEEHIDEPQKHISFAYNTLALVYMDLGKYDKALEFNEKSFDSKLKDMKYDEQDVSTIYANMQEIATSYCNMGNVYTELGNYDKALEYHNKALAIGIDISGEDSSENVIHYNNIGSTYIYLKEYITALKYLNKALEIEIKTSGGDRPIVASKYGNIGDAYAYLKDFDRALDYHKKALEICIRIFDEKHPNTGKSYLGLGGAYLGLGEYNTALEFLNKALAIQLENYGEEHLDIVAIYSNLGQVYKNLADYDNALNYFNRALNITVKTLDEKHPIIADLVENIAGVYNCLGDYVKMLECCQKALEIRIQVFGDESVYTAEAYSNVGVTFAKLNDFDNALTFLDKSRELYLKIFCETNTDNQLDIAYISHCIAHIYVAKQQYDKAIEMFFYISKIYKVAYGEQSNEYSNILTEIGSIFAEQAQHDEAINIYKQVLSLNLAMYGETHETTALSYYSIAVIYVNMDKFSEALTYVTKACRIYDKLSCKDNPYKVKSHEMLQYLQILLNSNN